MIETVTVNYGHDFHTSMSPIIEVNTGA
jgi:hypothetical protein